MSALPTRQHAESVVWFQAHRGAVDEAPENTVAALRYAWQIPGAVPEIDVRTTADGAFVCVHDATLARTTDAPAPVRDRDVSELTWEQVRSCDAGAPFGPRFAGERVPRLEEVLDEMDRDAGRQLYLDYKHVDSERLVRLLISRGVVDRVIMVHASSQELRRMRSLLPACRTMTWLGGNPQQAEVRWSELDLEEMDAVTQFQFPVQVSRPDGELSCTPDLAFLRQAVATVERAGMAPMVRLLELDEEALRLVLAMGVRWFVADAPARFAAFLERAQRG